MSQDAWTPSQGSREGWPRRVQVTAAGGRAGSAPLQGVAASYPGAAGLGNLVSQGQMGTGGLFCPSLPTNQEGRMPQITEEPKMAPRPERSRMASPAADRKIQTRMAGGFTLMC